MKITKISNINSVKPDLSSLKIVKRRSLKKESNSVDRLVYAIQGNSDVRKFFQKWDSIIVLSLRKNNLFKPDSDTYSAKMVLKYKEKITPKGILNHIKNLLKAANEVIMSASGNNAEEALKNLEEKIWCNDISYLLRIAERDALNEIEFNKRYKKILGIYFKRKEYKP